MKAFKLCLDAGHGFNNKDNGRFDPGAVSGGMRECDIALAWVLTAKEALHQAGIAFWLTRDDNTDDVPVYLRDDRAELHGCTHLLSIHCNASDGRATGVETFYRDGRDMAFAKGVLTAGVAATGLKNRGVKSEAASQHKRLAVFDFDGPAALHETGFIDRLTDRSIIATKEARVQFAKRLVLLVNEIRGE